jgi:hypothetical protein
MSNRSPFFHTVDQHNILSIIPRNCYATVMVTGAYNDPRYETVAIIAHGTLYTESILAHRDMISAWNKRCSSDRNGADYAVLSRDNGNTVYLIKRGADESAYEVEQFYPF